MPELIQHDLCTGCTACAAVCPRGGITMTADADGFRYPVVDEAACVGCRLCEQSCPVLAMSKPEHMPHAWAAYSRDTDMRLESSSGGVFTELARHILSQHGAVFGAVYDDRFRVIHVCAENEAELARLRGAKYAQSDLSGVFSQVKTRLDRGQLVLFSGTPCQVAGLLRFLRTPRENLITVDFVCHGVPSPMVWSEYVKHLGDVTSIDLRAKDTGWSRYRYCHRVADSTGSVHLIPNSESLYMKLFVGDYINRPSCADCHFKGYARRSDLTIGDFWGIWDSHPDMDDDRGTSVVLIQSERGQKLWEAIAPRMDRKKVPLEDASRQNPAMLISSKPAADREAILERIRSGSIADCAELFRQKPPSLIRRIRNKAAHIVRHILGR